MTSIGPDATIWHYDGSSATRHQPRLSWSSAGLTLDWEGGRSGPHPWGDLIALGGTGGTSVYGLRGVPGWRLGFAGPPPEEFAIHLPLPARYGRWIDRIGLPRAIALFAVLAAITVFVVLRAPGWIAPHVPRSWENRMGDAMVGDFGDRLCRTPASRAALDRLAAKLEDGTQVRQLAIANIPMVNAVTLPGGRILLFNGLVERAGSPDELAGVLAHEIGHVRHRDTVAALVRQLGLSVLLGGFNGQVGNSLNGLLAMRYSRKAEAAADAYSIAALRRADISPLPTAQFFKRLSKQDGGNRLERATSWFASHPASKNREQRFADSAVKGRLYRPALDAADWAAIRNACRDDKTVKPPFTFGL